MEQKLLETLQHCYEHSKTIVQILDLNWEVQWSNHPEFPVKELPGMLGLTPDHEENGVYHFFTNHKLYECRLLCNKKDGYRIAEIYPSAAPGKSLRMDVNAITASVQSMTSACHALYAEMEEREMYDQTSLLNILIGNCYRIYRMAFLQKEIDRLECDQRDCQCFYVNGLMRTIYQRVRDILRSCAALEMDLCEEQVYLKGDADEFVMTVLCALVLCYRKKRHFQQIEISLHCQDEANAAITVAMTPEDAELPPTLQGMSMIEVSSNEGEEAILGAFCRKHKGKWLLAEQKDSSRVSCTLIFRTDKKEPGNLVLCSPGVDNKEGRFFNMYEMLLSRIYYRNMF